MILIVGMPRSGTTWLGRLFDSHPDTLLRHEPDTVDRGEYAFIPDGNEEIEMARQHLHRLARNKSIKAAGRPPVFEKSYRGFFRRSARTGAVYLAKTAERCRFISDRELLIPDFGSGYIPVIKSVGLGRAPLWASAVPSADMIHIVRHPCGHVHSVMRGMDRGILPSKVHLGFVECEVARRYGLSKAHLESCTRPEALAWRWVVLTQRAIESKICTVCYEDICKSPYDMMEKLLGLCGLSPVRQCRTFLKTTISGHGSFFETRREPMDAATAWQREFRFAESVSDIVRQSDMRAYLDPA